MKKILSLLILVIAFSRIGVCAENIYFNFDYSVFKGEDDNSILEIYYSVAQKFLKYERKGSSYEGAARIEIVVSDVLTGNTVYSNVYKSPSVVADTSESRMNQKLIGQINYLLKNGGYKLVVKGTDFNDTTITDTFEQNISINNGSPGVRVSDIELSTSIKKSSDVANIFYKNTLEVTPNPSALYGMSLNELYYYFEIYGLTADAISEDFTMNYNVTDLNGSNIVSFRKNVKRNADSKADYGKIKLDSLKRGSYILKVTVMDSSKGVNASGEKKFYVFNNVGEVTSVNDKVDYLQSEYPAMSEDELENEFEVSKYLMSEQQIKRFEVLNSTDDKKKYMYDFWKFRDRLPETQALESKTEYMKMVSLADKMFAEAYNKGWKTDRGRIYLVYGKPDDIERFPFQASTKSYEIWKYNTVEGGGECVFIELQPNTSVYWLVHSTFRNELKNEQWRQLLIPQ